MVILVLLVNKMKLKTLGVCTQDWILQNHVLSKENVVLRAHSQRQANAVHVGADVFAIDGGCPWSGRENTSQDGPNKKKNTKKGINSNGTTKSVTVWDRGREGGRRTWWWSSQPRYDQEKQLSGSHKSWGWVHPRLVWGFQQTLWPGSGYKHPPPGRLALLQRMTGLQVTAKTNKCA